eukprot:3324259-Prymnesium_polylepis.2
MSVRKDWIRGPDLAPVSRFAAAPAGLVDPYPRPSRRSSGLAHRFDRLIVRFLCSLGRFCSLTPCRRPVPAPLGRPRARARPDRLVDPRQDSAAVRARLCE